MGMFCLSKNNVFLLKIGNQLGEEGIEEVKGTMEAMHKLDMLLSLRFVYNYFYNCSVTLSSFG